MTAREKIREALVKSREWYTQSQLMDALGIASSEASVELKALLDVGEAQRIKPPPGFASRAKFIYAAAGVEPPRDAINGDLPPKLKGFKAEARAEKRKAKGRLPARRANVAPAPKAVPPVHRWALASDGALVLLGGGIEIPGEQAAALAKFIDVLQRKAA